MDAARLYLLSRALGSFGSGPILNVYAIYYVRSAGLDPLQLVLVTTAARGVVLRLRGAHGGRGPTP